MTGVQTCALPILKPGKIVHVIADAHIYDKHISIAKDLIDDYNKGYVYDVPQVEFMCKDFYNFTVDDLVVTNYKFHRHISNIPVAV